MRTVAIINQKGGCGKTTTAINLSAVLAATGSRVLLVDMDPQSHCAAGLGVPENRIELDIGDAMLAVGSKPLDPPRLLWRVARNMDLAPSRMKLAGLEAARGGLADLLDRDRRLAAVLSTFKHDYDVVCIDCPPSIGLLTYNALAAADLVLIPVETGFFSLQGATRQVSTVRTLARRLGVQLPAWVLATIHDEENAVAADLLGELHRRFKGRVAPVLIRRDARLREAASFGQAAIDYAPDSHGAADYTALASWVRAALLGHAEAGQVVNDEGEPDHPEAEVHVPVASAKSLAERTAPSEASPEVMQEPKPVTRAEDVARRAQEFLRRVALSKAPSEAAAAQGGPRPDAPMVEVTPAKPVGTLRLEAPPLTPTAEPTTAIARLYGVRLTNQGVLFVQPLACGRHIAIAGNFNNWSTTSHTMRPNPALGVFELCVRLPAGTHRYRLVIDGQWSADPHNDVCEPNPFGEQDSIVTVGLPTAMPAPQNELDARRVSA